MIVFIFKFFVDLLFKKLLIVTDMFISDPIGKKNGGKSRDVLGVPELNYFVTFAVTLALSKSLSSIASTDI